MRGLRVPAPLATWTGSFILDWIAGPNHYDGHWHVPPDAYHCIFIYDPITALAHATVTIDLGGALDLGLFTQQKIPLPPKLEFVAESTTAFLLPWFAALTVSG